MNILLLAIDTLSARHMGCYGYKRNTTPFLDKYAKDNVLFESLYCQAIPTTPSFTSIWTGQYSITHGIVSHGGTKNLARDAVVLPDILQGRMPDCILERKPYTTCAVDDLTTFKDWFGWGFEYYINPPTDPRERKLVRTVPCEEYNARAIPWLEAHAKEKFFLFVHYWDTHVPYLPLEKYRVLFYKGNPCDPNNKSLEGLWKPPFFERGKGKVKKRCFDMLMPGITDAEYIAAMYDSEVRHADDGTKELVEALEKLGLADNTIVIILGDHGEMMYKHQIYFAHTGLYDPVIHVPLIIHWPEAKRKGVRIPHLVQHIDIAPTILDMVGISAPDSMEGKSLVPYINGELNKPIYPYLVAQECSQMMKWAIRTDHYKYILSREVDYRGWPMRELYDLTVDPNEMNNLAEKEPEIAKELENTLEDWIARMMKKNGLTQDPLVANGIPWQTDWGKRLEPRMQALGY